jgi:hypothetical protein
MGAAGNDGTISIPASSGNHQLEAKLEGYEPRSGNITVQAGERKPMEFRLVVQGKGSQATKEQEEKQKPPELGTLSVRSNIAGADVFVDGQLKGVVTGRDNKLKVPLGPGSHRIQLKKSGYEDSLEQTVEIAVNKEKTLPAITLREIGGQTFLTIDSNPRGASVRVDNRAAGTVGKGSLKVKVTPGPHTLDVSLDGYEPWTNDKISVKENENLRVRAELKPRQLPAPNITSFAAAPETIKKGERTQLKWEAQNSTDISIDNGVGAVRSPAGARDVQPSETTTYTLTAKGPGGSAVAKLTVSVSSQPQTTPTKSAIGTLSASPTEIDEGQSAKLTWTTESATDVSIDPGISGLGPKGAINVSPTKTTTYTLIAKGAGGDFKTTAEIAVRPKKKEENNPPPPDAESIKELVYKFSVAYGDCTELTALWPSLTASQCRAIEESTKKLKQTRLKDNCPGSPSINGDAAGWNCTETMTYLDGTQKRSTPPTQVAFRFKKTNGVWYVDGHSVK